MRNCQKTLPLLCGCRPHKLWAHLVKVHWQLPVLPRQDFLAPVMWLWGMILHSSVFGDFYLPISSQRSPEPTRNSTEKYWFLDPSELAQHEMEYCKVSLATGKAHWSNSLILPFYWVLSGHVGKSLNLISSPNPFKYAVNYLQMQEIG